MFKKVLLVFSGFIVSNSLYAQTLECQNSLAQLKNIVEKDNDIIEHGNVRQLVRYYDKYNYSSIFNKNHPGEYYSSGQWVDEKEYVARLTQTIQKARSRKLFLVDFSFHPIKHNQVISIGEICVIPIEAKFIMDGKRHIMINDWIFVRNLSSNKWRTFTYLNDDQVNFNEFFPDFPKHVQLK